MADRGRDLQFRLLSDVSRFDTTKAERQLDDLGDTSKSLGDKVDDAFDKARRAGETFADGARTVARRVDDAFDSIAKSAKTSTRKIDDDLDHAKAGLNDFKDEAAGSGREAAASFGGGFEDVGDFIQEVAANAFAGFGPAGAIAGGVAAIGIGLATKAVQEAKDKAEEAKEEIRTLFDAFVEGQGKLDEAALQGRVQDLIGNPEDFARIKDEAAQAGIAVNTYVRALAGDPDAIKRLQSQIEEVGGAVDNSYGQAFARAADVTNSLSDAQNRLVDPTATVRDLTAQAAAQQDKQRDALSGVNSQLKTVRGRLDSATSAYNVLKDATAAGITVGIDVPSGAEIDAVRRLMMNRLGTLVVPVQIGQSKYTNNANNSRYRW